MMIENINFILTDMDTIRIISILTMFAIFGYIDLKKREINDKYFIIFGVLAVSLIAVDYILYDGYNILEWLVLLASLVTVYILWKISIYPTGDFLTFVLTIVFMPTLYEIIPLTFIIMSASFIIICLCQIIYNVTLNLIEYKRGELFKGVNGSKLKKVIVFIKGHRHRAYEHHVCLLENSNKTLRYSWNKYQYIDSKISINKYVEYAAPLLTFVAVTTWVFLIPILYLFRG